MCVCACIFLSFQVHCVWLRLHNQKTKKALLSQCRFIWKCVIIITFYRRCAAYFGTKKPGPWKCHKHTFSCVRSVFSLGFFFHFFFFFNLLADRSDEKWLSKAMVRQTKKIILCKNERESSDFYGHLIVLWTHKQQHLSPDSIDGGGAEMSAREALNHIFKNFILFPLNLITHKNRFCSDDGQHFLIRLVGTLDFVIAVVAVVFRLFCGSCLNTWLKSVSVCITCVLWK